MAKANISNVPKAEPTMPKWILYLVFMTVIVFIFLGIKNYRSTRQLDTSDFQGQQWQRWILGPGKSSKVIMNNPRLITVESLGPNYIFSMSYIYKGKKEIAVYTWNSEKEEYGCWSQTNPPKKGFW